MVAHCPWDTPGKNTGVVCHYLPPGNLPDLGIEPTSPVAPASHAQPLRVNGQTPPLGMEGQASGWRAARGLEPGSEPLPGEAGGGMRSP